MVDFSGVSAKQVNGVGKYWAGLSNGVKMTIDLSLRTVGDFCHRGRDTDIAQNIQDCQNILTRPTIHWKDLEEQFLMAPLFFNSIIFVGCIFRIFLKKPPSLRS
jgi:hypothetical protein